ncbi:LuxR C-terminal-related transcriptional regulator [Prauserella oleivorans]
MANAVPALRRLLDRAAGLPPTCPDQPLELRARTTVAAWPMLLGDDAAAHELALGAVRDARQHAATGVLPEALALLASAELRLGHHTDARATATEGLDLAREIGQRRSAARLAGVLAMLAALEGDEPKAVEHAAAADPPQAALALSVLELGLGRHDAALDRLTALTPAPDRLEALEAVPTLVEAAVRAGEPDRGTQALAEYVTWANDTGQVWAQAVATRCRALLGEPELFAKAVELHLGVRDRPFERARTELLYGEWLRRERHRSRARAYLRSALAIFERLGATPWADRARTELRATGESRTTGSGTGLTARLTPQELRIVRLAADGLSNRDIGAKLYLSPRTVGYHLYKAYPKLGVASRAELAKLGLAS